MTAPVEIKINGKRLMKALHAAPEELLKALRDAGHDIGKRYMGFHAARRLRGTDEGGKGVRGTRRGLLSPRVRQVSTEGTTLDSLKLRIRMASPIAIQHEVGALLKPKANQWMAIPMSRRSKTIGKATDAMGRKTAAARQLLKDMPHIANAYAAGFTLRRKSGRRLKGLFTVRHKATGQSFLALQVGAAKDRKLAYWFHLKKSAQLKPRLDFTPLFFQNEYYPKAIKRFNSAVSFALKAAREKARAAAGGSS